MSMDKPGIVALLPARILSSIPRLEEESIGTLFFIRSSFNTSQNFVVIASGPNVKVSTS